MSDVATRLATAMKAAKFNQPQLARAASTTKAPVSQQVVQHLLSGRNKNSRHLTAIAEALGVSLDWLVAGRSGKALKGRNEAILIGKFESDEVKRFSDGPKLSGIEAPSGTNAPNVIEADGIPPLPFRKGWLVFYGPERRGVSEECLGKLCVVQVKDGPTLLKTVITGTRAGFFTLESWHNPEHQSFKLDWAARVLDIKPR